MEINSFAGYFKKMILWCMFFSSLAVEAQQEEEPKGRTDQYDLGSHSISLYGENNLFFEKGDFAYHFGTRLDLQTEVFGFYYKIGLGANPNGKLYMHVPLGLQAGVMMAAYAIDTPNGYYLLIPALLLAMVPEGVTARIWQRNNYAVKLYFSPWGSELNLSKENFTLISGEFGIQATVISNHRYNLSCYTGAKALYKGFQPAATIGATVGILLD